MTQDDQAANEFLNSLRETARIPSAATPPPPTSPVTAHITINRAVRCTIIVGQPPEQANITSVAEEIAKLAALMDRGLLTQAEFEAQKAALLRKAG